MFVCNFYRYFATTYGILQLDICVVMLIVWRGHV